MNRFLLIVAFGSVLIIGLAEYFVDYEDQENKEAVKEAVSDFAWEQMNRFLLIVAFGSVLIIGLAEYFVDYEDEENKEAVKEAVSDFAWEYPLR